MFNWIFGSIIEPNGWLFGLSLFIAPRYSNTTTSSCSHQTAPDVTEFLMSSFINEFTRLLKHKQQHYSLLVIYWLVLVSSASSIAQTLLVDSEASMEHNIHRLGGCVGLTTTQSQMHLIKDMGCWRVELQLCLDRRNDTECKTV